MTKANELVDARINYISFVKKGANGDPLRILKADDGQGLDLSALNKSDDDVPIPVTLKTGEPDVPVLAEEVIQKISLLGIGRAVRSSTRNFRHGLRAGYRYGRDPMGNRGRNLQTAVGHMLRSTSGAAGTTIGGVTARTGVLAARRIAQARARGQRVGHGLRAGYAAGRQINRNTADAVRRAYDAGARRSLTTGYRAGRVVSQAQGAARAGRVWVRDTGVRGGGYWRRLTRA